MISLVSAQDKPVSLILQHGFPSRYQTFHLPAPFSSGGHMISPLYFYLFSSQGSYMKWKDRTRNSSVPGNFGQRTYFVESLSITVIPSYLGETKTVVKETLILLCCQLCYLKYSGMTTGAAETSLLPHCGYILSFHPRGDDLMCAAYEKWKASQVAGMTKNMSFSISS